MRVKRQGSALLTALFIMTLIAIAATAMSTRLQLDIYRTRLVIQSDKLVLASQVVGFWAMNHLSTPKVNFTALDDAGKVLDFPQELMKIYPDMIIEGGVYDLQARLNLNSLQNKSFESLFLNLMQQQLKGVTLNQEKLIVTAIEAWITPHQLSQGQDEWEVYYTQHHPPYLPSYQPMQSVSELRLVAGVTPSIYQTMNPLLTALPGITPINVVTAPKSILMTLGAGLTEGQALEFIQVRKGKEEVTAEDLQQFLTKFHIPANQVTTSSMYYLSIARVKAADLNLIHYTLIQRQEQKNKDITVRVLSETLNAT